MSKKILRETVGCQVGVKATNELAHSKTSVVLQFIRTKLSSLSLNGQLQGKTVVVKLEVR